MAQSASDLALKGLMEVDALDDRQCLSYPTSLMLLGRNKSNRSLATHEFEAIIISNQFQKKLMFIKRLLGHWISHNGLGNGAKGMSNSFRWDGLRGKPTSTEPLRHVWVSLGAREGDLDREVIGFDPANPHRQVKLAEMTKT
jgi:hypothetical protein